MFTVSGAPAPEDEQPEENTLRVENAVLQKGFTTIPNAVLRAKGLSRDAKLLYGILLSYAWQKGSCFPGYDTLTADLECGRTQLAKYIGELKTRGLIHVQRRGQGKTSIYTLKDPPASTPPPLPGTRAAQQSHSRNSSSPKSELLEVPKPAAEENTEEENTEEEHGVVVRTALEQFGVTKVVAAKLATSYPSAYLVGKLDLVQWLQEHRPSTVGKNPAGYLRRAIEDDWAPPPTYQTPEQRSVVERHDETERAREQQQRRQLEQEQAQSREETTAHLTRLCPPHPIPGTPLTTTTAWDQTLAILESQMTAGNFAFIKQARLARCDGHTALIVAAYSYHLDQLAGRFHPHLTQALRGVLGTPIHCEYTSLGELADHATRHPTGAAADPGDGPPERAPGPSQEPRAPREPKGHHPHPRRGRPPKTELAVGP